MFYSTNKSAIVSRFSHLEFDRIFCGQYWDDLSCVGFLGSPEKATASVLMLGLADGAAIRPILSTGRVNRLVTVDISANAVQHCRTIYDAFFPNIKFETVVSDATEYLKKTSEKFDVIIVDLYSEASYDLAVFDVCFHKLLKKSLLDSGHIVVNSYGLPMHLNPFEGHSPQSHLVAALQQSWSDIWYLPHRRNATIIIGSDLLGSPVKLSPPYELKIGDMLFLTIMQLRLSNMSKLHSIDMVLGELCLKYVEIDLEMRSRWLRILPLISSKLESSLELRQPGDLRKLLVTPSECNALQQRLMVEKDPLRAVLPILVAGEINCTDFNAEWLPDLAMRLLSCGKKSVDKTFISIFLPQAYAVVIHGSNRYLSKVFQFRDALNLFRKRSQHEEPNYC